ncbi:hypothetical protein CDAR_106221 [Caerostris darwini]|uniref:Uncharacterized protein n=1 Tax=Caerostris darwini TaxID=1538125 RepID=A0AAV4SG49_9ARAC|nr:hypothetical protein CDAR_106221 [Caerostris darwini]
MKTNNDESMTLLRMKCNDRTSSEDAMTGKLISKAMESWGRTMRFQLNAGEFWDWKMRDRLHGLWDAMDRLRDRLCYEIRQRNNKAGRAVDDSLEEEVQRSHIFRGYHDRKVNIQSDGILGKNNEVPTEPGGILGLEDANDLSRHLDEKCLPLRSG